MRHAAVRKPTNVSLDVKLVEQARELGINISRACEGGLEKRVAKTRGEQWLEQNREAMNPITHILKATGFRWPNTASSNGKIRCVRSRGDVSA